MSEDRAAGFWSAQDSLHARQALPGVEVAKGVSAELPQSGDLSGEHRQPGTRRCREVGKAGLGRSARRISSAGRNLDDDCGAVAKAEKAITTKDTKDHEGSHQEFSFVYLRVLRG